MKSLYDLLGARADDDAQAIKKAFREAVKAHHPDLHPDDPDAISRFRQIVTANAVLRDENQRAAYDHLLELERRHLKLRLNTERVQLEHVHRQARRKRIRAAAVIAVIGGLISAYGLFMPMPMSAIVAELRNKPAVGTVRVASTPAIVEAIRKDEVGASIPGGSENAPAPETSAAGEPAGVILTAHASVPGDGTAGSLTTPGSGSAAVDAVDKGTAEKDAMDKGAVNAGEVVADRGESGPSSLPGAVPHDAGYYRDLGISSYRRGDFPHAIADLDAAIGLDPGDAHAHNVRGNALDETGVFDSALADYDEAIRIDPNNPIFFQDRAVLWYRKGDLDKALVDLDRAIRFSFSDPNLYCARGLIWYEKGSHARATADFDHAIKLNQKLAAACIFRGLILHRDSEFTVALTDLGRTIRVSPSVFDVSQKLR